MTTPSKINLAEAFSRFDDAWNPRILGDVNAAQVKVAKFRGAFDWHHHETEDELFLVVSGRMRMGFRGRDVDLESGELIIVPAGVEHRPQALSEEAHVLIFEPATTLNTGTEETGRTRRDLERLD
ncbi:cupin domain-containing protein [Stakelama saccharophila]|uniref:Cupin domain-containing protein n=1 Tax=Stakelama saccharophila TaxID=3075605 RepID=A0ABZ0BA74_9SPHN|nr:cupin domain-containing protein [Stakelama sp. W311]WNO54162.1 cupin domain-containing protein [Stakelama sp. W311]